MRHRRAKRRSAFARRNQALHSAPLPCRAAAHTWYTLPRVPCFPRPGGARERRRRVEDVPVRQAPSYGGRVARSRKLGVSGRGERMARSSVSSPGSRGWPRCCRATYWCQSTNSRAVTWAAVLPPRLRARARPRRRDRPGGAISVARPGARRAASSGALRVAAWSDSRYAHCCASRRSKHRGRASCCAVRGSLPSPPVSAPSQR